MATSKTKSEKEITVAPENVNEGTGKSIAKKATAKKKAETVEAIEPVKLKKAAAKKEEKMIEKNIEAPIEKKSKKTKSTVTAAPKIEAPLSDEGVVKKAGAKKKTSSKQLPAQGNETVTEFPAEKVAKQSIADSNANGKQAVKVTFQLRYATRFGQKLFVTGNHEVLGNNDIENAFPLQYFNQDYWYAVVDFPDSKSLNNMRYNYLIKDENGAVHREAGSGNTIDLLKPAASNLLLVDAWKHSVSNEEADTQTKNLPLEANASEDVTHIFKVRAPRLAENQAIFIAGNIEELGDWFHVKLLNNVIEGYWVIHSKLPHLDFPIQYKYGVYDVQENKIFAFEIGENRVFYGSEEPKDLTVITDGFVHL